MADAPNLAPGVLCRVDLTRDPIESGIDDELHGAMVTAQFKCPNLCLDVIMYATKGAAMWRVRLRDGDVVCLPGPTLIPIPPDELVDEKETKKNKPKELEDA